MNCRRAQYLLSPYVDERLTGQQMLEVRDHLDSCPACSEEYLVIRQVKTLLRSMAMKDPGQVFQARIHGRVASDRLQSALTLPLPVLPMVNRGRRLAYALALSCVGILSVAAQLGTAENAPRSVAATRLGGFSLFDSRPATAMLTGVQTPGFADASASNPSAGKVKITWLVRRQPAPPRYTEASGLWNLSPFAEPASNYNSSKISFVGYSH